MGVVVGIALGVAGALTQSLFGNPLAEPGVIGITSGASVGAAISIVIGATTFGMLTTPAFGLATALLVWSIAQRIPAQRAISMLLVGIAINALAGAATAFIFLVAPTAARDAVVFWQLGSIAGTTWTHVWITTVLVCVGLVAAVPLIRPLDVLALGDRAAGHVGLRVPLIRIITIVLVSLLTGAGVALPV